MTRNVNSPEAIAYFGGLFFAWLFLVLLTIAAFHKFDRAQQRRRDTKIFKVAEEARRDFR